MEQTETKEISSNDNAENHEVDIAGEFGNFAGRADVLEAFYCYQEDDFLWDMDGTKCCNGFYIQFRQSFAKETFSYD